MTVAIACQGLDWAILAADSKVRYFPDSGESYVRQENKIRSVGKDCWVMWGGSEGPFGTKSDAAAADDDVVNIIPHIDMKALGAKLFTAVWKLHQAGEDRIHQRWPDEGRLEYPNLLIVRGGSSPKVAQASDPWRVIECPVGASLGTISRSHPPTVPADDPVAAKWAAVGWLAQEIAADRGERMDWPVHVLTVTPSGATAEIIEQGGYAERQDRLDRLVGLMARVIVEAVEKKLAERERMARRLNIFNAGIDLSQGEVG
jgi:hypothetical protein